MNAKDRLLELLPPGTKVVDCADCGALASGDPKVTRAFRGLAVLAGWRKRSDHYRPICAGCRGVDRPTGITTNDPETHAYGQKRKLKQRARHEDRYP